MKLSIKEKSALLSTISLFALATFLPSISAAEEASEKKTTTKVVCVGNIVTGNGATIANGDQNTAVGLNVQIINGTGNQVDGTGALASNGDGNTAIGTNSQIVSGTDNKAVGFGAQAGNGDYNTAIGRHTSAGNGHLNTAMGSNANAINGHGNVAVGSDAYAGGSDNYSHLNTAVGYGAQATAGNSVAIGAFSVANRPDSVSVGEPGYERQITNVAPGVFDTDAVNMSQLRGVESRVNRVGASAIAMSALVPLAYNPAEPTQYSAGIGTYNGKYALAIGIFHYTKENVLLNAAVAFSGDGWERAARFGVTWRMGKKPKPAELPKPLIITPEPKPEVKPEIKPEPQPVQEQAPVDDNAAKVRKG